MKRKLIETVQVTQPNTRRKQQQQPITIRLQVFNNNNSWTDLVLESEVSSFHSSSYLAIIGEGEQDKKYRLVIQNGKDRTISVSGQIDGYQIFNKGDGSIKSHISPRKPKVIVGFHNGRTISEFVFSKTPVSNAMRTTDGNRVERIGEIHLQFFHSYLESKKVASRSLNVKLEQVDRKEKMVPIICESDSKRKGIVTSLGTTATVPRSSKVRMYRSDKYPFFKVNIQYMDQIGYIHYSKKKQNLQPVNDLTDQDHDEVKVVGLVRKSSKRPRLDVIDLTDES